MNYAFGVDIGGTNTEIGLVDEDGRILHRKTIPTINKDKSWKDYFQRLSNNLKKIINLEPNMKINGIGLGAPNASHFTGIIQSPPNLTFGDNHVPSSLKQFIDLDVKLTNDANAAALGENMFGHGRKMKNFVVITLGTGLGSGIFINGELLVGHRGFAGEMGHVVIDPNGRICECGKAGCLEMYSSSKGFLKTIKEYHKNNPKDKTISSIIKQSMSNDDVLYVDGKILDKAYDDGDKAVREIYRYTGKILGRGLGIASMILEPEAFIFYGGISCAGDRLLSWVRAEIDNNLLPFQRGSVSILESKLNHGEAGILGAASLIFNTIKRY
tara:strand:+ start:24276 stop:25256 length:981 start_codon:yes stop_codon:yes gene_type:complete